MATSAQPGPGFDPHLPRPTRDDGDADLDSAGDGPSGEFRWDLTNGSVWWSEGLFDVFECAQPERPQSLDEYLERVHPSDRARVRTAIVEGIASGEGFRQRERVMLPGDRVGWIDSRAVVEFEGGVPVRVVGRCRRLQVLAADSAD